MIASLLGTKFHSSLTLEEGLPLEKKNRMTLFVFGQVPEKIQPILMILLHVKVVLPSCHISI